MSGDGAHIEDAAIVGGHDARAELKVRLRYPNGGAAEVRLDEEAARYVLDRAGIRQLDDLRGRSWDVLKPAVDEPAPRADGSGDADAST